MHQIKQVTLKPERGEAGKTFTFGGRVRINFDLLQQENGLRPGELRVLKRVYPHTPIVFTGVGTGNSGVYVHIGIETCGTVLRKDVYSVPFRVAYDALEPVDEDDEDAGDVQPPELSRVIDVPRESLSSFEVKWMDLGTHVTLVDGSRVYLRGRTEAEGVFEDNGNVYRVPKKSLIIDQSGSLRAGPFSILHPSLWDPNSR